ncbi:MAG: regulatory protein RecX, partial [Ornithinimicrobium sp.]
AAHKALEQATQTAVTPPTAPAVATPNEEHARARQVVLRQLAMGPRSRKQLADKLRDKDVDPEVIEAVLDRMTQVGLVDDEAYAAAVVRSKHDGAGMAPRALRHELHKRGVASDTAERAIGAVDADDERSRAEQLVTERLPRLHGLDRQVQTRRLAGLLARKGYPSGLSLSVIRDALDRSPEHARD